MPVASASERRVASGCREIGRGPGPRTAAASGDDGYQTPAGPGAISLEQPRGQGHELQ